MAEKQHFSTKIEKGIRVYLTLNSKQAEIVDALIGELGNDRADVVKNILLIWLSEKEIMSALVKKKMELT